MSVMTEVIIIILILLGTFLSLASAFGILRLPDVYTRNHAASKSTTLGVLAILVGTLIYFYSFDGEFNSRIVLGIIFIFITAPVSGHLIARAAYYSGVKLSESSSQDDLAIYNKSILYKKKRKKT